MTQPLHLLRFDLDIQRLFSLCSRQRLPVEDLGYVVHAGLAACLGDEAPSLFSLGSTKGELLELLAYSPRPLTELREQAEMFADPEAFALVDWQRAADKPMPVLWRAGQRLGFQLRVCPTVRMSKGSTNARAGAEVDSFLAVARRDLGVPKPDRATVYREWLAASVARREGARVVEAALERFTLQTLVRKTHGHERVPTQTRKPDVTLRGVLEVTQPDAFATLLRRGVGRHRAFGFGMLLLRPPPRGPSC